MATQHQTPTAQSQIDELVRAKLLGRKTDCLGFVDEILRLAQEFGEVRCIPGGEDSLRFSLPGHLPEFEVRVDAAVSKFRMMCARLAKLCQESGHEFRPYGGEGVIKDQWKVRYKNTGSEQEFTIVAA